MLRTRRRRKASKVALRRVQKVTPLLVVELGCSREASVERSGLGLLSVEWFAALRAGFPAGLQLAGGRGCEDPSGCIAVVIDRSLMANFGWSALLALLCFGTALGSGERQGGNGRSDAVRLSARGILRGV